MAHNKFKILIIQLRQLGDVILTTPLIRQLRSLFPNAQLHFLSEELGAQVYQYNPYIDRLIILAQKINFMQLCKYYYKIYMENYDLVIDCFGNPKSAQFTFFSRASERIGFNFFGRRFAYTKLITIKDNNEYSAISKLRLIEHYAVNLADCLPEFFVPQHLSASAQQFINQYCQAGKRKIIVFHVVSRRAYKIWPFKEFAYLANRLIDAGYFLLFTYAQQEYLLAQQVYAQLADKTYAAIDYPIQSLAQLKAILELCHCYIGNDGGIKHLAVCANLATFTIFQEINCHNWTVPKINKHMFVTNCLHSKEFCKNCTSNSNCIVQLTAEQVWSQIAIFLCALRSSF